MLAPRAQPGADVLCEVSARTLLEALPDAALAVDARAEICCANARAQAFFGYHAAPLQGLPLGQLLPDPGAPERLHERISTLLAEPGTHLVSGVGVHGKTADSALIPVSISMSRSLLGRLPITLLLVRDRSAQEHERAVMEAALDAALRSCAELEGASVGIARIAGSGEVTHLNEAWRQFSLEARECDPTCVGLGENYLDACHSSGTAWGSKLSEGIESVLSGARESFELLYSCHSPERLRWVRLQARKPLDGGHAVVLTHIDNTEAQLLQTRARIQGAVSHIIAARRQLVTSCRTLGLAVCDELAWDYLGIWLPNGESWQLQCVDSWVRPELGLAGFVQARRALRLPPETDLPGRVWSSRRAEWVTELEAERLPHDAREAGLRSGFAFAVKYDDDVLAVIEVLSQVRQAEDAELLALLEVAGIHLAAAELRERAEQRATAAQAEADAAREELEAVLANVPARVIAIDRSGALRFVNHRPAALSAVSGYESWRDHVPAAAVGVLQRGLEVVLEGGPPQTSAVTVKGPDGKTSWYTHYLAPIGGGSHIPGALIVSQDVTQMKQAEEQLYGAQRLASLGTLAAGVAHEINTPIQFVGDSLDFLRDAARDTDAVLQVLRQLRDDLESGRDAASLQPLIEASHAEEARADLGYLIEHVPHAFARCADGLERVTSIVRSMKEFSHPAQDEMAPVDLNRSIMATLTVARNEYKYVADLKTELSELPLIMCHINDLNQAILNIVVNAAQAIGERVASSGDKGLITVRSYLEGEDVVISITDTGGGIPDEIRDRIFDPFFTTKEVGRGTGQGLAIAWTAVVERHGGRLTLDSAAGVGTTFFIHLPLQRLSMTGGSR